MESVSVRPGRHRQLRPRAPFDPGAVVEAGRLLAERIEREPQDRGGDAGAATRHDRLVEIDAAGLERRPDPVGRDETAVFDDPGIRHVAGARHMTGAHAWPGLRRLAAEALGRARVDDLRAAAAQGLPDVLDRLDGVLVPARREPGGLAHDIAAFDGPSFCAPR